MRDLPAALAMLALLIVSACARPNVAGAGGTAPALTLSITTDATDTARGPTGTAAVTDSSTAAALDLRAVRFVDTQHGWVGGAGTILVTRDGGNTWLRQYAGADTITDLDFVSGTSGWALGEKALLRTTDGGGHWMAAGEPAQPLQHMDFVTTDTGWGIADDALYVTSDGGATWRRYPMPSPAGGVCFSDPRHGWAVNAPYTSSHPTPTAIFATEDGGTTWSSVALPPGISGVGGITNGGGWFQILRCAAPDVLWDLVVFDHYAGGEGYLLARSTDGGRHWSVVVRNPASAGTPPPPGPVAGSLAVVDGDGAYLVGMFGAHNTTAIGRTTDAGRTWRNFPLPGLPYTLNASSFPTVQRGWLVTLRAGTTGSTVLSTTDAGSTWRRQYPPASGASASAGMR